MTTKSDDEKEKEPSTADKVMKRIEEAAEVAAIYKGFGMSPEQESKGKEEGEETLPATLVKAAMDSHDKAVERAETAAKESKGDAKEALQKAEQAKEQLYQVQIQQIGNMVSKMDETLKEIKAGAAPKTATEVIKEAKDLMETLQPSPPSPSTVTSDPKLALELEKMREDHELAMKNFELQLQQSNQEFQLKLTEFSDNRQFKMMEYKDNQEFREKGLQGFGDLVGSIGAGITKERAEKGEVTYEASMSQFPCQNCQTPIEIEPGAPSATCPQCGTVYKIRTRE